jgi:DNA repair protein RadC
MPQDAAIRAAAALKDKYGTCESVYECAVETLAPYMPENAALLLSLIPQIARYMHREKSSKNSLLDSCDKAEEYLRELYLGEHYEIFRMLLLDEKGRLLECATLAVGTVDETPLYARNVLETALRHNARAVVLSHNHPGGTPRPSAADIESTLRLMRLLPKVGIALVDHIIVADRETISMRRRGHIEECAFLAQGESLPLLKNWI